MKFIRVSAVPLELDEETIYLEYSYWDDYGFCTTFTAHYKNQQLGTVKIGCKSLQSKASRGSSSNNYASYSVQDLIPLHIEFDKLPDDFFSLGQDVSYYKNINHFFPEKKIHYLTSMKDLSYNFSRFKELHDNAEACLTSSLMRNLYVSNVEQFHRITTGGSELTPYSFSFEYLKELIEIDVIPDVALPNNIHVLIGRNGVGKTWLLHNMVFSLLKNSNVNVDVTKSEKYSISEDFSINCPQDSFAGIIGLSFSVFDDALSIDLKREKPEETGLAQKEIDDFKKKYKYIGLVDKNQKNGKIKTKSIDELSVEFKETLKNIKENRDKIDLYLETCSFLNADPMFKDNGFIEILDQYFSSRKSHQPSHDLISEIEKYFKRLSSGHMIIILSLTLLAESIFEKTIVLIDEPETHLHPPLLSTYIRALSHLLIKRNAVAIIATHSPIILQEVPRNCVNKINRTGRNMSFSRIETQTFATSVDTLTREVFGLEVVKTGFYQLIEKELDKNFDTTYRKFDNEVGFLGQILIQSLLKKRESDEKS
ncbi:AAA family ATPase [Paenibacillus sp. NPDC093718]|uniref:AAA family ATPase n=1 Tax=Paenibacillus sp. NPDC093718 TaxID=3390601 RepID=UPI003D090630